MGIQLAIDKTRNDLTALVNQYNGCCSKAIMYYEEFDEKYNETISQFHKNQTECCNSKDCCTRAMEFYGDKLPNYGRKKRIDATFIDGRVINARDIAVTGYII